MKKPFLLIGLLTTLAAGAQEYWQQAVHYTIHVTLNDITHSLNGTDSMIYENHSPDTLSFIWFHIWPNAYKNSSTAFYKQLVQLNEKKDFESGNAAIGYIDSLDFKVNGISALTEPHPKYIDVVKLLLPSKLAPGQKITISTPFHVKIPNYFSRLGHQAHIYMISQWYPKPAVYDHEGWHPMPYLDQGEFYSEFGSFDVHITVPSPYVVAATGILETASELSQYQSLGRKNLSLDSGLYELYRPADPTAIKTLDFHADSVHDFAWFADKYFIINYDTMKLASGKEIGVYSYYRPGGNKEWVHGISFIKDAVAHLSSWVGEYPYPVVSAVEGPGNISSGGMEYPMITLITSPHAPKAELDGVIAHEIGHNWFYGALGSNERDHPWMDEGVNSYYEFKYEAEKYRFNGVLSSIVPKEMKNMSEDDFLAAVYHTLNDIKIYKAIETPAYAFNSGFDYAMIEYAKTAVWMYILEKSMGEQNLEKGMKAYFENWKFRHPYPKDMQNSMESATGIGLSKLFDLLNQQGPL